MPAPLQSLYSRRKRHGQNSLAAAITGIPFVEQSQPSTSQDLRALYDCVEARDRWSASYAHGKGLSLADQSSAGLRGVLKRKRTEDPLPDAANRVQRTSGYIAAY